MKCKDCEYHKAEDCKDALCMGYCPNYDDDEDFMTAVCREIDEQNIGYMVERLREKK